MDSAHAALDVPAYIKNVMDMTPADVAKSDQAALLWLQRKILENMEHAKRLQNWENNLQRKTQAQKYA